MKNLYKTLIVEDHSSAAQGFVTFLDQVSNSTDTEFITQVAYNLADAYAVLKTRTSFDLVILDIRMKPHPEFGMHSGLDLGSEIRKRHPGTLIIVFTLYSEPTQLFKVLSVIDPDGFFVKGELIPVEIVRAIKSVLNFTTFYSPTVLEFMRNLKRGENLKIDDLNRQILFELAKGHTLDKVAELVPLSRSAIAKRLQNLKRIFDIEGESSRYLIQIAREKGII